MYTLDAYWGGDICRLPCAPIWRRKWQPTPVFLPGEFQGQRSLVAYGPWGHKESDTTEWLTLVLLLKTSAVRDGYMFPGVWRGYIVSAFLSLKICYPGSQLWFFFVNEERRQQTILPIYQMKVVGTKWVPSSLSHSEPQKVIWGTVLILPRGYLISFHVHGRGAHLSHTWDALQQWGLLSHGHGRPCQRVARLELSWEWYEVDCEVRRQ